MATSIHIPSALLRAVDRHAHRLKISRNRFIVRVLEKELARETAWSPGFFEALAQIEPSDAAAIDDMLNIIRSERTRKRTPRL